MIEPTDIHDFWNWFKVNCNELHADKYPNNKLAELDRKVTQFGLRWEVGPGIDKENSFTISPNGDKGLINTIKEFISNAPIIASWEFYNFKQPKANWQILELPHSNIKITADNWAYTLLRYKDGKKEILIKGDTLAGIEPDSRIGVVEIVLTNLLGEEKMMNELDYVDVLDPEDYTYEMHDIQELNEHLDHIKNGA